MQQFSRMLAGCAAGLWCLAATAASPVLISEIMYHPSSEAATEEYVELYNAGSTDVSLLNWRLKGGVEFTFPAYTLTAHSYLVVAADPAAFSAKYPGVANRVGSWGGILSNSRDALELVDANGVLVDQVIYADEGDWAQRWHGALDQGHRGWTWYAGHDGLGKSLELINAALPNESGQNWASSAVDQGTPGAGNSVAAANIAPLISQVQHAPIVPSSSDPITITAVLVDEQSTGITVSLFYRIDAASPPAFSRLALFDDGMHGDGLANDGRFGVVLSPFPNNAVVEFYIQARDASNLTRTWPGPAWPAPDEGGSPTQSANALFQVDDEVRNRYQGGQPVYKVVMREAERVELAGIPPSGSRNSDAQMNATFISMDGNGTELRYLSGVRNRGHGSRGANPPNYRVNFASDHPWKGVSAININSRSVHVQHLGAVLAQKAGVAGGNSRAAQVRINNANLAAAGSPMFGSYAVNEALDSDWGGQHYPMDGGGNLYKVVRDIRPPNFDYRGENPDSYRNTYFKQSNTSEDDWTGLIGMLAVMGENSGSNFTEANVRRVSDPEQWLRHMALMSLFGNNESGLNTGNNDDYFLYQGVKDPRFILVYHDLDSILGESSLGVNTDIFRATCCPISGDSEGSWRAMDRFLHAPAFEPIYYRILQELLDTTFSAAEFDPLVDQTLGGYVDAGTINNIKNWMSQRRSYVQSVIASSVQPSTAPPQATITGAPRSPTPSRNAVLVVGGEGVTHYRYRLNNGAFGAEQPVGTPINLTALANGSTNQVSVIGRTSQGTYQATTNETVSLQWVVDTSWPTARLSEALAYNAAGINHEGTFPDFIELHNEGPAAVDLTGFQLTDNTNQPGKFVFPAMMLPPNGYLVVWANAADGTSGLHAGFALDQDGEGVFLYDAASRGGALLDALVFGIQIADHSIGRIGERGDWQLGVPSPGAVNTVEALGNPVSLVINEWLAANGASYPEDYLELYNGTTLPIALGGLYLTDNAIGFPKKHRIHEISFIASHGWATFESGLNSSRPRDLGFRLSAELGQLALLSPALTTLDCVAYGPQQPDTSMGRCADGGSSVKKQSFPSPGTANACPTTVEPNTTPLIAYGNTWRYEQSGANQNTQWREPSFNDGGWASGPGVFARPRPGGAGIPEPVGTVLDVDSSKITFYFRAQFNVASGLDAAGLQISHIIDDGVVLYLNGQEIYRYNMPSGTIGYQTLASGNTLDASRVGPISLPTTGLQAGQNTLAAEVHQASSTSADIVFGLKLDAITTTAAPGQIYINEVFANNATQTSEGGATPDWVEFYNPSTDTVDLAGLSLGDSLDNPLRWVFPAGSIIAGHGFFAVRFDSGAPPSNTNTGFGLSANGDLLLLFNPPGDGGGVIDSVEFGLQPADFSIGRAPDGAPNWTLNIPTIGAANLAASLGNPSLIRINEWMAAPISGDDWFELFNPNPQPVSISRFSLTDDLGAPEKQPLPALSFLGAQTNGWRRFEADGNPAAGANHTNFKLDATGETIALFSDTGSLVDVVSFGQQQVGVSQGRLPDGQAVLATFADSPSPGQRNYLTLNQVVINETLTHTDPPLEDAIELYNPTGASIDIGGWWLSDSRSVPQKYQIPPNTSLGPNAYAVFYEASFNNGDVAAVPFALSSADGDEIYLSAVGSNGLLTGYRAGVEFGPAENGVSFGRHLTSAGVDFVAMSSRSFGVDNPADVDQFRMGAGLPNPVPKVGPVVITEIQFQPPLLGGADNVRDEFVELHNPGAASVPLFDPAHPTNTWRLRKGIDFNFPPGVSLSPGSFLLVVSFDPQNDPGTRAAFESVYGAGLALYGPYSGKLDNDGEAIELQKPDPPQTLPGPDFGKVPYIVVERIIYAPGSPWPSGATGSGLSLQRSSATSYGNEPLNWFAATPTPGPAAVNDDDHDGIPNDWETLYGLDPNNPGDANLDPDMDGFTNRQEYDSGTDPNDPNSYLQILNVRQASGSVNIIFQAAPDRSYSLYYATNLPPSAWIKLTSVPSSPTSHTVQLTDPIAPGSRFYRLSVP